MNKQAHIDYGIDPLLQGRWSPRSFEVRSVEPEAVRSVLEAARWAASCMNEQPWRFVVARREDPEAFERILSCLAPGNQRWANGAGVLMVSVAETAFDSTGKPNRHAWHDVGLAVAQLTLQAQRLGLSVHQMAGFDEAKARDRLCIPAGYEPVAAIAMGYPGAAESLPEDLRTREVAVRSRRAQREFAFGGRWGQPLAFPSEAEADRVLAFWFGELDEDGLASGEHAARWWKKDSAFDQAIRAQFGVEHAAVVWGERDGWLSSARGRLAYLIVLDQFSRNMFRDQPHMFAFDGLALDAALAGIELGMDRALPGDMRAFYYLPLMHSERLEVQEACVKHFEQLVGESSGRARDRFSNNLKFAIAHRDIVRAWGRFPHRNAILGRASAPAEIAFLQQPGSSF